ncbi:unnamed protein product, partial [Laminaria digitata]
FRVTLDGDVELVSDIRPGAGRGVPSLLTELNGELYFTANDGIAGREIHRVTTDGNVELAIDLVPNGSASFYGMAALNNTLYFSADLNNGVGSEIYEYTPGGSFSLVADVWTGADGSASTDLFGFNGSLYFNGTDDGVNRELFRYDTSDGSLTEIILDANRYARPVGFTEINGSMYFGGQSGIYRVNSDHTITQLFAASGSSGVYFTEFDGAVY